MLNLFVNSYQEKLDVTQERGTTAQTLSRATTRGDTSTAALKAAGLTLGP